MLLIGRNKLNENYNLINYDTESIAASPEKTEDASILDSELNNDEQILTYNENERVASVSDFEVETESSDTETTTVNVYNYDAVTIEEKIDNVIFYEKSITVISMSLLLFLFGFCIYKFLNRFF